MTFMLTIPVIVPFWQDLGLTMREIFQLQAVYGLCLIILDVPLGYFSDLFGRRRCLIFAGVLNIIAFQILYRGSTFAHFVWFEVVAAISYAFYTGSDIALLYDSTDETQSNIVGKKVFYSQLGESCAALLSSVLAAIYLRLPAEVNVYTSCVPLIVSLTLLEPERERLSRKNHLTNISLILKTMFGQSMYLNFLIVFNIVYGLSTYFAVWTYQSNWKDLGIPVALFGVLWFVGNFATAIVARNAVRLQRILSNQVVIILIAVIPVIVFTMMGIVRTELSLVLILFMSLSRGLNSVVIQHEINEKIPSSMKATANSFCSLGMRGAFFFIATQAGSVIDQEGISTTLLYAGNIYILPFIIVTVPIIFMLKSNTARGYSTGYE